MLKHSIAASLLLAGIIHLLPLAGVLGAERLSALYGLDFSDPNLSILMRHRAVMFGLLGAMLVAAAFKPAWQPPAFAAGLVSAASFLALAWSTGGYNGLIGRVVTADIVAVVALLAGSALYLLRPQA